MAGKRVPDLDPLSGAASANDDKLVIYDASVGTTKRIDRSQLAEGLVSDLPLQYYLGVLNANPTQRLNGDALQLGDYYLDSATKYTTVYNGTGWNSYASVIAAQAAAEAARDAAQLAETNAETAETNAETAETNAETAEAGAVAAQALAEAARDVATDLGNAPIYGALVDLPTANGTRGWAIIPYGTDEGIYEDVAGSPAAWTRRADTNSARAQAWAEGTEPGGPGTKSAKEWAEEAATSAEAADAALSDLTASVDQITPLLDDALLPIYERPSTSSFAVGTFREWVTGASGAAIGAGTVIDAVSAYLLRPSAAATVEARLYSRAGTTWSSAPDQDADTAEWADWVSLSTTGTTADVSTLFRFTAPAPVTVDAGRYYYVVFRAKQSGGSVANLGFGRWLSSATGAGTPWPQLERGYFRNDAVPVTWNLGSIGSVLPIRFEMRQSELVRDANDVPERPSPRIGTRIIAGRQEFVLDNGTSGRTYRAIFAIPAKAVWVRPIFAHAALTPVLIDAAAVAPIASAANFAASGATWTPVLFNKATSGLIPAAAGSLRRGWLAADRCDVTTLDRTDVTGAAHLVAVSCFIRQTGTLTMMGNSAGTTDYTGWASRTDRPFVLRYNDGDCVTTPASFTSTTNRSTGPIVGIQYELESGEVVTLGGVGDSITDGAGGSLFGLSWGYNAALALQKAWRNADWVNLGWSGITMGGVANLATDFYAFARSAKLTVPTIMFTPNASPNSITPPITTVQMTNQRPLAEGIVRLAQQSGSVPIVWTIIPTNPSVKDYGSSDSERRDYNDDWRTDGDAGGIIVADMDAIMAGVTDGDGQVNIVAGAQTDGIHPNDTGHGLTRMGGVALRAAQAALPLAGFAVGELVT